MQLSGLNDLLNVFVVRELVVFAVKVELGNIQWQKCEVFEKFDAAIHEVVVDCINSFSVHRSNGLSLF